MQRAHTRKPPSRRQIAAKVAEQVIPALNLQIHNLDTVKHELDALGERVAALEALADRTVMGRLRELVAK